MRELSSLCLWFACICHPPPPHSQLVVAHTDGEVRGYSAVPLSAAAAAAAAARNAATATSSLHESIPQGSSSLGTSGSAIAVASASGAIHTEGFAESLQREKAALLEEMHAVSLAQQRQAVAPRLGPSSGAATVRLNVSFRTLFY